MKKIALGIIFLVAGATTTALSMVGIKALLDSPQTRLKPTPWVISICWFAAGVGSINNGMNLLARAQQERLREQVRLKSNKNSLKRVCRGCCHYHGVEYGGNMLICAMHPVGVEGDNCPDYQNSPDFNENL
ncbi:hypothetical protein WKK05_39685 (plasmid) [Nostoc sp. UHCC 0302]|uniref:hypothetical protein n=1 Tax=Nostoc sp. UHCC 0302 TaxID=3134896 RepID=UPI00311C9554